MASVIDALRRSDEPSVRWKVRTQVLGEPPDSRAIRRLQGEIRRSPRVQELLAGPAATGKTNVYVKWRGAHWVLAALADLGYPPGDEALAPLRDRVLDTWLSPHYLLEFEAATSTASYRGRGVPVIRGRYRRCASQQGNALRAVCALGIMDHRAGQLVERLASWQWPDGGWNCDRNPDAAVSSFFETMLPMRGLAAYARKTADPAAEAAALRAAEVFLSRRLLFGRSTGKVIRPDFVRLHHPVYWHYDVLGGLTGMVEVGRIDDPRCADALDLLESKRLPDGGWPAERRFYRTPEQSGGLPVDVDWGGISAKRMNEWVTVEALAVLTAAGRQGSVA